MTPATRTLSIRLGGVLLGLLATPAVLTAEIQIDLSEHRAETIKVSPMDRESLRVSWPTAANARAELVFDLRPDQPLIRSVALAKNGGASEIIVSNLEPVTTLTIGQRDKKKFDEAFRGMVFFENPREKPFETQAVKLTKTKVRVFDTGQRVTVCLGEASAGSFHGDLRFTFYPNSPMILAETVVTTSEDLRAILYDTGLSSVAPSWNKTVWLEPNGQLHSEPVNATETARPLAVKQRTVVAEGAHGSIAIFPAPHKYFYPLDFADNFSFNWIGHGYSKMPAGFGFGIRQPPEGDQRWVPWFDAPPHREHHLGVFYLVSTGDGSQTLAEVAQLTHGDRFKKLAGYHTFTSHYHVEHTLDYLERQKRQPTNGIPLGLETPGFVTKFKETGVDIVHLGEFHQGWTPNQKTPERLAMQKLMHEECERLSDRNFLLLPGEEPNVHLGGHWMSFFPKPIYWVLNRTANEPFMEEIAGYGKVYHVGSAADVLNLMQQERGLMWTAHARIKGSKDFPDGYRDKPFFQDHHFLGAAWKSMPGDLSRPTLGWRVLDLLDDMNQWGQRKQAIGEVDVFRVEPDYELYAHMNVNYLRLDKIPRFEDGWQPVLDTLRDGAFFTTTGEILIPKFTVAGKQSGETISSQNSKTELIAELEWTFPLAFAEIVSGDGKSVHRERIDLTDTKSFHRRTLRLPVELKHQKWIRFEVWDIAANGAYTQPIWIE